MRHEKQRITLIVSELMNFFFSIGATNLSFQVQETDTQFEIRLSTDYLPEKSDRIQDFLRGIQAPRQIAMEEYYWELLGASDIDTEISIVGMMVESGDIQYDENSISVTLFREKSHREKKKK